MIIISIILFLAVVSLGYGCFNLIRQNEQLEDTAVYYQDKFNEIREMALQTEVKLKELDIRGSFSSDDEVGFVFKDIQELQRELNTVIANTYEFKSN
jgi:hypothetical protein